MQFYHVHFPKLFKRFENRLNHKPINLLKKYCYLGMITSKVIVKRIV